MDVACHCLPWREEIISCKYFEVIVQLWNLLLAASKDLIATVTSSYSAKVVIFWEYLWYKHESTCFKGRLDHWVLTQSKLATNPSEKFNAQYLSTQHQILPLIQKLSSLALKPKCLSSRETSQEGAQKKSKLFKLDNLHLLQRAISTNLKQIFDWKQQPGRFLYINKFSQAKSRFIFIKRCQRIDS